jgi:hypothetical protein
MFIGQGSPSVPRKVTTIAPYSALTGRLAERFAPATANGMLAALRGVRKAAFELGLMSSDHMTRTRARLSTCADRGLRETSFCSQRAGTQKRLDAAR